MIAALTMTSEREEVIDFIAPYFEQTGISIGDMKNYIDVVLMNLEFTKQKKKNLQLRV